LLLSPPYRDPVLVAEFEDRVAFLQFRGDEERLPLVVSARPP